MDITPSACEMCLRSSAGSCWAYSTLSGKPKPQGTHVKSSLLTFVTLATICIHFFNEKKNAPPFDRNNTFDVNFDQN